METSDLKFHNTVYFLPHSKTSVYSTKSVTVRSSTNGSVASNFTLLTLTLNTK